MVRVRAPAFDPSLPWLNSDRPLSLQALRGQIVLLDFWTYGCINCLHVIPDLHYLEQKYAGQLTIISIHTAKFAQEQAVESIQQAILRYGMTHPVLVDRDRTVWDQYAMRAYPTFVVIDPQGYIVATLAGEGRRQQLDDLIQRLMDEHEGNGTLSENGLRAIVPSQSQRLTPLAFPGKVLADESSDTLFIADTGHDRLVLTTLDGTLKATIGTGVTGAQDGAWETAQFSAPQGMALDASGQILYVADAGNHLLRQIDLLQKKVSTLAGTGVQSRFIFPHGGKGLEIALNSPWDLVLLDDQLYMAMAGSHQIWVMDLKQQTVQTFMGTGAEGCVDGSSAIAAFAQPYGLTTDGMQLFIADSETSSIRAISLGSRPIATTLCGQGQLFGFGDRDGIGAAAQLQHCSGLVYANESLWIADTYNHKLKQLDPITQRCGSIAGGEPGFDDGTGLAARFAEPSGVAYARDRFYIADTNNHAIRCLHVDSLTVTTLPLPQLCSPYACTADNVTPGNN
ncbi:MAG: thioredoxin-like domain-containing protein [Leptolyngbya sp. BL-A-14]